MPIFQDPDRQRFYDLWSDDHPPIREDERQLGGSSWAHHHRELESAGRRTNFPGETFLSDCSPSDLRTCDREELIHYIKNADTSAWAHRLVCTLSPLERQHSPGKMIGKLYSYGMRIYSHGL